MIFFILDDISRDGQFRFCRKFFNPIHSDRKKQGRFKYSTHHNLFSSIPSLIKNFYCENYRWNITKAENFKMKVFAWSPIRELMKKSGAEMVSRDAVDELIVYLEKVAKDLTNRALEMSRHSGRKKLTKADMLMSISLA